MLTLIVIDQLLIENYEHVFDYLSAYGVKPGMTTGTADCQVHYLSLFRSGLCNYLPFMTQARV
jgi:hypothetical protein